MNSKDKVDTRIYNDNPEVRAQQSAKDECDINLIVESAKRGADISHLGKRTPIYGDFRNLPDYREAALIVAHANEGFASLDAKVRERFANDPGRMIEFLNDAKNREEAIALGLVQAPEVPQKDEHLETLKSIDSSLKEKKKSVGGHGKASEE